MFLLYLIAILPVALGIVLFALNKEVVWAELAGSSALAMLVALIAHLVTLRTMTGDTETWSGQIDQATHHPRWVEKYRKSHTRTTGSGKNAKTTTYYTTEYRTHSEFWDAQATTGETHTIDQQFFRVIGSKFGGIRSVPARNQGFHSGDNNLYVAENKTGFVFPTTTERSFENRIQAAKTLFNFAKVPKDAPVYPYPKNDDWLKSNRLVGPIANLVSTKELDVVNSTIGPVKKANLILVGFRNKDQSIGQMQQSAWSGGKKNDLVLCFDVDYQWAYCFGWTEQEIVKKNLESIILEKGLNSDSLGLVQKEIMTNYVLKDWHKFDYIDVAPSSKALVIYAIVLVLTQAGYWIWAHSNQFARR